MKYLAITLPGGQQVDVPSVPQGGLTYTNTVLSRAITILLILAVVLSIAFIAYAGFQWATSGGDKSKLQAARSKLTWAIVGLVIAFLAIALVNVIAYFLNAPSIL